MKRFLRLNVAVLAVMATMRVSAGTTIYSWTGSQAVPDNDATGIAYTFYLSTPTAELINNVTVNLNIAGGWNGDLYGYLSHGSGFSVLINRIGRTAGNPDGSPVSGMNVTFADSYVTDIHTAVGNPLNGNFAPDGRIVSPYSVLNTDPRSAMLGSFNGQNVGGFWTLFIADVSPLSISTIQSWSVNITTAPVPEPSTAALLGLAGLFAIAKRSKRKS